MPPRSWARTTLESEQSGPGPLWNQSKVGQDHFGIRAKWARTTLKFMHLQASTLARRTSFAVPRTASTLSGKLRKRHEKLQSSPSVCGLGVGFFKHSRGNCGVFREAVFALRFGPAREPLTKHRKSLGYWPKCHSPPQWIEMFFCLSRLQREGVGKRVVRFDFNQILPQHPSDFGKRG